MSNKERYLTVKEMRDRLNNLDLSFDNHLVIISRDSEGNQYKVIDKDNFIDTNCKFVPDYSGWCGNVAIKELTDKLIEQGYTEQDLCDDESALDCIVLYPMD